MAETRSGIFTFKEFTYRRNVLRMAPDAFVTINDSVTSAVVAPMNTLGTKDFSLRGGITSISINGALTPGASRASIEVVAPQYKGLHQDYYMTMPNGVKVPIFTPMMEVKIYMKGRYLEQEYGYAPRYYPVFWGMITGVQENYSGGTYTFSITCEDLLSWWKYQKITIQSSSLAPFFGGAKMDRFPSVFKNMSPWEIILALFSDTFFTQVDPKTGQQAFFNFVYPQFSQTMISPQIDMVKETWGPFAKKAIQYWNQRFGFGISSLGDPSNIEANSTNVPLEMYGFRGQLDFNLIKDTFLSFLDPSKKSTQTDRSADLTLDYGLLAKVQPYGTFDLFGDGAEPNISSKLEIATNICEKINMEFFVDTNGFFVFKPPFYNLDVATGNVPYYRVGPQDVIAFNANFDSNAILNLLTVTGPLRQELTTLQAIGVHADFESIKQFGIRSEQISVPYGMNANQLRMIAVAEMARRNGQAYSASVTIPLRPEIRMGYPIYIEHIDTFYYVTGVSHSITFGSTATTDLSLQYRRERMFDDGSSGVPGSKQWDVLAACVLRSKTQTITNDFSLSTEMSRKEFISYFESNYNIAIGDMDEESIQAALNEVVKQKMQEEQRLYSGPGPLGYWEISKAKPIKKSSEIQNPGTPNAVVSNELVMITDVSVPYTDINGYRHIGGFPYGANLAVMKKGSLLDMSSYPQLEEMRTRLQVEASPEPIESNASDSIEDTSKVPNAINEQGSTQPNQQPEVTAEQFKKDMEKARKTAEYGNLTPASRDAERYLKAQLNKSAPKSETFVATDIQVKDPGEFIDEKDVQGELKRMFQGGL